MPVLVIMPDNNLSYGVRCDAAPPEAASQLKPSPEGGSRADEHGDALLLSGAHPSAMQPAALGVTPTTPGHGESLPRAAGGQENAAWQHGYACGTAAAAAAFSRQTRQQATEPAGADDSGAADAAEGDVESGLPSQVRCLHIHVVRTYLQTDTSC